MACLYEVCEPAQLVPLALFTALAWATESQQAGQPVFSYKHNDNFKRKQCMSQSSLAN